MSNQSPIPAVLRRYAALLARPAIPFFILPMLGFLLVAGTISQRYIGLYESQKIFFASLPAIALLGLLALSLTSKFLFFSPWTKKRAGINLSHLGILVLLIGGFLTALTAKEGSMVIPEQDSTALVQDYHIRDLMITGSNGDTKTIPFTALTPGKVITIGENTTIEIIARCKSCQIERRDDTDESLRSMAKFMRLTPGKPKLQNEENITGITLRLRSGQQDQDGTYILFDPMPKPVEITAGKDTLSLIIEKRRYTLPFSLYLGDFQANHHPGTMMAKAYHSDVIVKDGTVEWPVRIEMNAPLRYKGYTFFQSSFFKPEGDKEYSVFAVVENRAWLFPYIGTGLMAFGLLLHLVIMMAVRRKTA